MAFEKHLKDAIAAHQDGREEVAVSGYRRAAVLQPSNQHPLYGLGILRNPEDAEGRGVALLRRAAAAAPGTALVHYALGNALLEAGAVAAGRGSFKRALVLVPGDARALANLGRLEIEGARHLRAEAMLSRALSADPEAGVARSLLGEVVLARGDVTAGWPLYFARMSAAFATPATGRPPLWRGEALTSGPLLVNADGGLGDGLMHARFLARPPEGVSSVVLRAHPPLAALMRAAFPKLAVIGPEGPDPPAAAWTPLSMLAMRIGAGPATSRFPAAYLRGVVKRVARIRTVVGPPPSVGLCWRGGGGGFRQRKRAIDPGDLEPLARLDGLEWLSLQVAAGKADRPASVLAMVDRTAGYMGDAGMVRMARDMAGLDLVITVDTYVAHLAGALGIEAWVLLPHGPEWRWGTAGETTPWYPKARLFCQQEPGRWHAVMERVAMALCDRLQ